MTTEAWHAGASTVGEHCQGIRSVQAGDSNATSHSPANPAKVAPQISVTVKLCLHAAEMAAASLGCVWCLKGALRGAVYV